MVGGRARAVRLDAEAEAAAAKGRIGRPRGGRRRSDAARQLALVIIHAVLPGSTGAHSLTRSRRAQPSTRLFLQAKLHPPRMTWTAALRLDWRSRLLPPVPCRGRQHIPIGKGRRAREPCSGSSPVCVLEADMLRASTAWSPSRPVVQAGCGLHRRAHWPTLRPLPAFCPLLGCVHST